MSHMIVLVIVMSFEIFQQNKFIITIKPCNKLVTKDEID